jgi:NADH-quinone oxidoreductase subunit G
MSDSGRLLYKEVASPDRLAAARIGGAESPYDSAVRAAAELLERGATAVVGSGRSSVEEQFLTKKLAEALKARAHLVGRAGAGDGILISADRNPNVRGALVTGLAGGLPGPRLDELAKAVDSGSVRTIVSVGEDLAAAGLSAAQIATANVVYLGTHRNATSDAAKVLLPTLTVFEKGGTLVNQQFRIQKFEAAVPGPAGARDDLEVLSKLAAAAGAAAPAGGLDEVWAALSAEAPVLAGIHFRKIPGTGLLLDGARWSGLPFAEGRTLHYEPRTGGLDGPAPDTLRVPAASRPYLYEGVSDLEP